MFTFVQTPKQLNNKIIISIPKDISSVHLTKGMNMGVVQFKDFSLLDDIYPIEPDGIGGHFILLDNESILDSNIYCPLFITVDINITWLAPMVPDDLKEELINSEAIMIWNSLTIKAMWEWIRWIRSTSNFDTRMKRIHSTSSMLLSGKRRPCCFNTTLCTLPNISKSGILLN